MIGTKQKLMIVVQIYAQTSYCPQLEFFELQQKIMQRFTDMGGTKDNVVVTMEDLKASVG